MFNGESEVVVKVAMADWKVTLYQLWLMLKVLLSGRLTYGPMTRKLEKEFAEIHGAKHALFTSSGTAALKISLHALKDKYGWKDGSEVIIPSVTFVATMNAVLMNNLKPVLVDVDINTANIDPDLIKKAITKRTVAIMPVHLLGQPAEMDRIMEIAKKHKLRVVTDSCETMFVNQHQGDTTCFSSYIAHLMVTGVGGFILTDDDELATVMRSMMFHGRDESYLNIDDKPEDISKRFYFPRQGYSDRATEMEAAIGLGDLRNWQKMIKKRQQNAQYILFHLSSTMARQWSHKDVGYMWSPIKNLDNHAFMFLPLLVPRRDELMVHLEKHGIQTRTMMPLISQPVAKPYVKGKYPAAEGINKYGLLIGCHQYLSKRQLDHIVNKIKEFYENTNNG